MAERQLELVRQGVADVHAFWDMLDEHVVWDLRASRLPDLDGVYMGREAVIRWSRHYWGAWEDYRIEIEELVDAGSGIVVMLRERGRGRGSGAPWEKLHPQVWTFRGDRIVRWESFETRADALAAAGL
jgi:ketosteroid isomerase-like protein